MTRGTGTYMNPRDGDVIEMDVELHEGRVAVLRMDLRCCAAARRAARELASRVQGLPSEEAARLATDDLVEHLRLDADQHRCALTVIGALRAALVDAHVNALA